MDVTCPNSRQFSRMTSMITPQIIFRTLSIRTRLFRRVFDGVLRGELFAGPSQESAQCVTCSLSKPIRAPSPPPL